MRRFLPLLLLTAASACPALAQQVVSSIPVPPSNAQIESKLPTEEQKDFNRKVLRGEEPAAPASPREPRLAEAQIREDFRRLQVLNNQLQSSAASGAAQYQEFIKPLSEIGKRARRLKTNLLLPARRDEGESSGPQGEADVETLLRSLDESVKSFVRSPMFASSRVFDVALSKRAGADLQRVIELCRVIEERIRKEARR